MAGAVTLFLLVLASPLAAQGFLPVGSHPPAVEFPWFPDRAHAVVFRNWKLVDPERIAKVLGTDLRTVEIMAGSMGLPPAGDSWRDLDKKAYITIVRRNWHLLPYAQLLELLDMSEEKLRFSLKEDDFLFVKLGRLKPKCSRVAYASPDEATKKRLDAIRGLVGKHFGNGLNDPREEPRFAFVEELSRVPDGAPSTKSGVPGPDESLRFIYSYFGAFGDPLLEQDADPYPDGLLARLAAQGVNGVWLHTVLRHLAPGGEHFPEFGEGHETRLATLRRLVARAKARGIGVYLYMNEPRSQPLAFFKKASPAGRAGLRGVVRGDHATLCTSDPRVRDWIRTSLEHVFRAVPDLGGIFTISASENLTSCASHFLHEGCSRCSKRTPAAITGELHRAMLDGVRAASPTARVIAWDWGWNRHQVATDYIDALPEGITVQSVSEWSLPLERGGVKVSVGEYCLSEPGPGPRALAQWKAAKARGLRTSAKLQMGTTWELGSVPFLPVLDLVAEHARGLAEAKVDDQQLSWTVGGYPSPNLQVAAAFHRVPTSDPEAVLDRIASERYGERAAPHARAAWQAFSRAFREFPYSGALLYNGPQHVGAANPLWLEPTGFRATMVGIPYDDLDGWRGPYPRAVLAAQFEKLAKGWKEGLRELERAVALTGEHSPALYDRAAGDLRIARVAGVHFESSGQQARFIAIRDELAKLDPRSAGAIARRKELRGLLQSEIVLARDQFALSQRDARLGFEASNHYFYVPLDLVEKVLNCEFLLACLDAQAVPGERPPTPAVQTIYREGVPHTDRRGKRRLHYDSEESFFPIGTWGAPESRVYKGVDYRWNQLVEAGYNTVWPWAMGGYSSEAQLAQAKKHGLQVVIMRRPEGERFAKIREHPNLLGIVWQDEPLLNFGLGKQEKPFEDFLKYRKKIHELAPDLPVFVNTSPWIVGDGREWWLRWNRAGDIACHDNYPIWPVTRSINRGSFGTERNGLADSVSLAFETTEGKKPLWLIVGAFDSDQPPRSRFPFRYPTPAQLRALVYAGIIHGATGITYYAWDSNITRFGIAPRQQIEVPGRPKASPLQAIQAKALWETAAQVNRELRELTPVILSPTAGPELAYEVEVEGDALSEYPIRALRKNHPEGGTVLLLVNLDHAALDARIRFATPPGSARVLFENREGALPIENRAIALDFEPFEVHVVRIDEEAADLSQPR